MSKEFINDEALDQVVGGFLSFNYKTKVLTYTHEETGEVKKYKIDDFMAAWKMSNNLHSQCLHEDNIIAQLKAAGYISE